MNKFDKNNPPKQGQKCLCFCARTQRYKILKWKGTPDFYTGHLTHDFIDEHSHIHRHVSYYEPLPYIPNTKKTDDDF